MKIFSTPLRGQSSGQNLRYAPIYDKIKEARREDDELNQGAWQHERKVADWALVSKLCQDAIAKQSKDLQLAAWLCESLVKRESIAGLREGLALCRGLIDKFWDNLYPELDEGDAEQRAAPLDWVTTKLLVAVRTVSLCRGGYHILQYKESRSVPEESVTSKEAKAARDKALKEGKLAPEMFDRSFAETPKAFYSSFEKSIDGTVAEIKDLDQLCQEKFTDTAPGFSKLTETLAELRQVVHTLLQKKRETEPDPVEEAQPEAVAEAPVEAASGAVAAPAAAGRAEFGLGGRVSSEPEDKRAAIAAVVAAAAALRKRDPASPAAYLMLRGLRWGELRGSCDPIVLEAPPSDLRQQVKALAMRDRWAELLELAEQIMALPVQPRVAGSAALCSGGMHRAGRRVQRHRRRYPVRTAHPVARPSSTAGRSPDGRYARGQFRNPEVASGTPGGTFRRAPSAECAARPRRWTIRARRAGKSVSWIRRPWPRRPCASGSSRKQSRFYSAKWSAPRSGRARFLRKMQLARVCLAAGKDAIAQILLDDVAAAIDTHKLDDWEDREMIAGALVFLVQSSKKIQADAKAKQALFERICRLDPVQALSV